MGSRPVRPPSTSGLRPVRAPRPGPRSLRPGRRLPLRPRRLLCLLCLALAALPLASCRTPGAASTEDVAKVYLQAGRFQDAAREAEAEIRKNPHDVALRKLAARAYDGAGNLDRAIDHLDVALDLAPEDPEVSILLGEMEQKRGNLPDAYVAFRRAAQLGPDQIRAWTGLALSAEALGFETEAQQAYARWAQLEKKEGVKP